MAKHVHNIYATTTVKFTLKERLKVLLGYRLTVQTVSRCVSRTRVVHTDKKAFVHKPIKRQHADQA